MLSVSKVLTKVIQDLELSIKLTCPKMEQTVLSAARVAKAESRYHLLPGCDDEAICALDKVWGQMTFKASSHAEILEFWEKAFSLKKEEN